MCLQLNHSEAILFRDRALDIEKKANEAVKNARCDPLLVKTPLLSRITTAVRSMQIQHGYLIEDALIFAINKLNNWRAEKERVQVGGVSFEVDCIAYNSTRNLLYAFECKRGNSITYDKNAIESRLQTIESGLPAYASSKGLKAPLIKIFVLSFYGSFWENPMYLIYTKDQIAELFEPCLLVFFKMYLEYIRKVTMERCKAEFNNFDFSLEEMNIDDLQGKFDKSELENLTPPRKKYEVDWMGEKMFKDEWFRDEKFEELDSNIFDKAGDKENRDKNILFNVDGNGNLTIEFTSN